jgi:methenyltetrahydromethanopterin cyclohydrolase
MLAQLAEQAGLTPVVIDCFCDLDTQQVALVAIKVESLALEHVVAALSILQKTQTVTHVMYGSGFETHAQSLNYLHQHYKVLGNSVAVFTAMQEKAHFFATLKSLHIAYPRVSFQAPQTEAGWLIKPMQGEGGMAIRKYNRAQLVSDAYYWQERIDGMAMSVLFVTDGNQCVIQGFHKLQQVAIADNDYVFQGLISQPDVDDAIVQTVTLWIEKLVRAFALKGINSLDFMVEKGRCYALEVNARPSASMQLYMNNLLTEHIKCFVAGKLAGGVKSASCRGYKIIFATSECVIKTPITWPEWALDIPEPGSLIHTGLPICSIIAAGENEQYVEEALLFKQQIIQQLLR